MNTLPSSSDLYALWTIQDSLLQYYRTIFITAQSVLISIAVSVSSGKDPTSAHALVVVGLLVLFVWIVVTWSRARDVSFAQHLIKRSEEGRRVRGLLNTFKEYQDTWPRERKYSICYADGTSEPFVPESNWPPLSRAAQPWRWGTRSLLEFLLPFVFAVCWLFVFIRLVVC